MMFDEAGGEPIALEPPEVMETPTATHLRYRGVR
jgi:hypothetical protein